jgi:hypothetical protein
MKFKLGCDPEIFLLDQNEKFFSAIDTFGGTKARPRPLLELGTGFCVQEDNVALEFNIPPSDGKEVFVKNVNSIINFLADAAKDQFGCLFSTESAALWPEEQLTDIRALEFGCDPDYNAWTGKQNPRPKAADWRLRSAGGHVHVGVEEKLDRAQKRRLIRLMDLHLGVPSVVMDKGDMRKEMYGKHGAMRFKSYGVEYRTLSNFWIFSPVKTQWVWDATERAMHDFAAGRDIEELHDIVGSCIDGNNKTVASQMISDFGLCYA